jgi:GTP-binding protein EngB required for normal cell division
MNAAAQARLVPTALDYAAIARRLSALLDRTGLHELANAADAARLRLRTGVCTLAVVGEFKRGKSTLINALIGADLFPVGALPLTTVGTRAEFGESVSVVVEFVDGRREAIPPAAIADYATERGNPGNQQRVSSVTVTTPSPLLRAPLCLIDTPGIGSAFADVSGTARALLGQADAALVVLSAEQPASRRELEFVRDVIASGASTFVVENKIDLVPPSEQAAVLEFVREQLRHVGGEGAPLFAVSSADARHAQRRGDRGALGASGLPALEQALVAFGAHEGPAAVTRGARRRLLQLVDQALARVELERCSGPLVRQWQGERQVQVRQRLNVVLFRDMLDGKDRVAATAEDIAVRLACLGLESDIWHRLDGALNGSRPERWRPARYRAAQLEARVRHTIDGSVNQWSDAERATLAAAAAELTTDWRFRGIELLVPIVGPIELPAPPVIDFRPPLLVLPSTRLTRPLLLPGKLGCWQARRRVEQWLRNTLPAMLEARRAAVAASVAAALHEAEERFHKQLEAVAESAVDKAPVRAPVGAGNDAVTAELRRLRVALTEEGDDR